ncbi:MAG: glycosyltransferase family 4 protein [Desulfobaccales bacterium]
MKKIGILGFPLGSGGLIQYADSMFDALALDKENKYILFLLKGDSRYDGLKFEIRKVEMFGRRKTFSHILKYVLRVNLLSLLPPDIIRKLFFSHEEIDSYNDIDLFISPAPRFYPHYFLKKPYIMTVHDFQEKYFPEFFTYKDRLIRYIINKISISHCTHIITESNYVKKDIINFFNYDPDKISVLPSPPPMGFINKKYKKKDLKDIKTKYNLPDSYIFYPAQYWYHKNHIRLLEAFKVISNKYSDLYLVLTGAEQNNYDNVVKKIEEYGLKNRVMQLGYIEYADLPALYLMSRMLIMPTLFESVSMPIYESFMLRVPVCCSNVVALPEQVANAGLLFNPNDTADIAEKALALLDDEKLGKELAEKGYNKIIEFNHKNYATKLKQIINEAKL